MGCIGPSRLKKGYRGAAQPSAVLMIRFEVLLRVPANQRVRQGSCLRLPILRAAAYDDALGSGPRPARGCVQGRSLPNCT